MIDTTKDGTEWRAVEYEEGWEVGYPVGDALWATVAEGLDKDTAHLIAAAREVRDALDELLTFFVAPGHDEPAFEKARAALAKARPK